MTSHTENQPQCLPPAPHRIVEKINAAHPLKPGRSDSLKTWEIANLTGVINPQNFTSYMSCRTRLESRVRDCLLAGPYKRMNDELRAYGYDYAWQLARTMALGHKYPEYAAQHVNVNAVPESMVRISNAICTIEAIMAFIEYLDQQSLPVPHVWHDVYLVGKNLITVGNVSNITGHIKSLFARDLLTYAVQCDSLEAENLKNILWEYAACLPYLDREKPRRKPTPTDFPPGSPGKVFVLAARYINGEELFCDEDCPAASSSP